MAFQINTSLILALLTVVGIREIEAALDVNFYTKTCPQVEKIVSDAVSKAVKNDPRVSPRILRMFFHDCFIRGCDASVLLDSTAGNTAEKDGPPNISLAAFYVIDNAKRQLEKSCPQIVSCADILAIAARDVVVLAGGRIGAYSKEEKMGGISKANDTVNLPAPSSNASQLIQSFDLLSRTCVLIFISFFQ